MPRALLSCFLIGLLLFSFSQKRPPGQKEEQLRLFREANSLFQRAEKIAYKAGVDSVLLDKADSTYLLALQKYDHLLPLIHEPVYDSLRFICYLRKGFIHYYFDSLVASKKVYLEAIRLHTSQIRIPDSLLFTAYMYTGGIYYTEHSFDSSTYYYRKAEDINIKYLGKLEGSERLYNRLGALYYETGNYKKAKNYIEKAISLTNPKDSNFLPLYKINLASLLVKLESYEEAKKIYNSLLPSPDFENEIYHNLAIIALKEQDFEKAISYLRRVNYQNDRSSIDLYYNFGIAYSGLDQPDSADFYLQRALAENTKWNGKRKNVQLGLIYKYQADEMAKQQLFK
jgi:tetratricopeptide (TPR) repeat protein